MVHCGYLEWLLTQTIRSWNGKLVEVSLSVSSHLVARPSLAITISPSMTMLFAGSSGQPEPVRETRPQIRTVVTQKLCCGARVVPEQAAEAVELGLAAPSLAVRQMRRQSIVALIGTVRS